MSPAHVQEPTYQGLKARLKSGVWPMGMRLEAIKLADELGVSVTPVRDSLNRLVGERLVELWPGEGYRVARLTERLLRDLFLFNRDILARAAASAVTGFVKPEWNEQADAYPDRVAELFLYVAGGARNAILVETVEALNDRLYSARCHDPELIAQCETEIEAFAALLHDRADPTAFNDWLASYHDRCCELAAEYVVRLELGPNPN